MKKIAILSLLVIFLSACKETKKSPVKDEHTAEYVLDYEATYKGILPCADCPGIETSLTLNKDKTFVYTTLYLDSKTKPETHKGTYTIKDNTVTIKVKNEPIHFFIGESMAIFMGKETKPNTGELAKHYEMRKMPNTEFTYSGIYKGTYPCADCSGIEATLVLRKDKTFEYITVYRDKKGGRFTEKGTYTVKDNVLKLGVKDEPVNFLIGANKLSLTGKEKKPNTGGMAKFYDLKKQPKFSFEGKYETFSEEKGAYNQTLSITPMKDFNKYMVDFSASKVRNREACKFSSEGNIKNDTLWVDIAFKKGKKIWMYIVPSHDNLGLEVFTKNFDERFQMMVFCGGGSSLAGYYLKKEISADHIGTFDCQMTIADVLQNIPAVQVEKTKGKGEFAEDVYDDYKIYNRNDKHLFTVTPKFAGSVNQRIDRVLVKSPFFKTAKGISVKSTYGDIKKAYKIDRIEPTREHIVLVVDKIKASFSISKKKLQKGWWNDKTKKVDATKIPDNAQINDFVLWWDH